MKPNNDVNRGGTSKHLVLAGFLTALLWLQPAAAQAQAIEAWVQLYSGPWAGDAWNIAKSVAVDANGNVFVTGESAGTNYGSSEYATIKYSSAGVLLWANRYSGPGSHFAFGNALALNPQSDVLVTGGSYDSSGIKTDCVTFKYSNDGVTLWTNRYNGPGNGEDIANAIAVDSGNNVIVTGESYTGLLYASDKDYATIKYSSDGVPLWVKRYGGLASDRALAVAVDGSDNVFVTGESIVGGGGANYATLGYSSAGVPLWTNLYGPPEGANYRANAIAVDTDGNVYVTGRSDGHTNGMNLDFATIKYSGTGVLLWTNWYNGSADGWDAANAMVVDAQGDVFVTGYSYNSGSGFDYATIKYSSAGMPLWTNFYNGLANGEEEAKAIAVDISGNVYVTGYSAGSGSGKDIATVAYSSVGVPLWTNRYDGPGNGDDEARAIAVDGSGNVYVTGFSHTETNVCYVTIKYGTNALVVPPPLITGQPLGRTNAVGTTASFIVEAASSLPLSYQWRREGTNLVNGDRLSGVTTTNLLIANVQPADAGGYTVVVTNTSGSTTSKVAQLTVISHGRFTNFSYSPDLGFTFIFRDASVGQHYRIQTSTSLAPDSWVDWQSFNYTAPVGFLDFSAVGDTNRFYRAVSP